MKQSHRWLASLGAVAALSLGAAPVAQAAPGTDAPAAASGTSTAPTADFSRTNAAAGRFGLEQSPVRAFVERAINGDDYQCDATALDAYVDGLIGGLSSEEFLFLVNHLEMLDIPTYDALLHGTTTDARYDLRDQRLSLTHTFRDVKRFWDIQSGDIQLMAMHGDVLRDPVRTSRALVEVFGFDRAGADRYAADVADALAKGWFDGGNQPLFTLNAFAFTAEGDNDPLVAGVPDKLIFGDGILDALRYMGLGDIGPRAVMGHEFGHHVQFEDGLFETTLSGAEATRRTELMADAFGTYFTTHARGLALNTKRVLQVEQSFYQVGDCQFASDGHHGTPLQRLRASTWAADYADAARPQGKILPSLTFARLFEEQLPSIVAPDKA